MAVSVMQRDDAVRFSAATDAALDQLWLTVLRSRAGVVSEPYLRDVARRVSTDAHQVGMLPEQLIIAVRDSWSLHRRAAIRLDKRYAFDGVVTEMISMCIEEFYDRSSDGAGD